MLDALAFDPAVKETVTIAAEAFITVRVIETQPQPFKWESPVQEWQCVEVISENYGNFETGFKQWVFKALMSELDCEEDVELTRTDGSGKDVITIIVPRGMCP